MADARRRSREEEAKLLGASFEGAGRRQADADVDLAGKTLVINFLGDLVRAVPREMPDFVKAQKDFGGKGLQFVGIAVDRRQPVERSSRKLASTIRCCWPTWPGWTN